ncbi:DUF6901 family protein [Melioribacter sp. OK-6-Me]|uniref:DUF6901 family protein n=1 Tax=unclassified Melioribacter TaxID=2627329 RepID=UPI003ED8AB31
MNNEPQTLEYIYTFKFEDGSEKVFTIQLDAETLNIITRETEEIPEWAYNSDFPCNSEKCNNSNTQYCPIALHLDKIIRFFSDRVSYEKVFITADINGRHYSKETTIQNAVSSLIGIIMPSSGCPILGKLKPLVKYHLPFSSIEETEYRVYSMYLFAQYLRHLKGLDADWEMKHLHDLYAQILDINRIISQKIAQLENQDASCNAIIALDNFAQFISFNLEESDFSSYDKIFRVWFD